MTKRCVILGCIFAWAAWAGDWDGLSRVKSTRTVRVYLRDGRVLRGGIHQFGPDGLAIADSRSFRRVKRADIDHHEGNLAPGEKVTLRLRQGQVLEGSIEEVDGENVWLLEPRSLVPVKREDVVRVTARARGLTAVIGGVAAGGIMCAVFSTAKEGDGQAKAAGGIGFGAIGAAAGAIIGRTVTLYASEMRK